MARRVGAPFVGEVQRRKGDHRVGERLADRAGPSSPTRMLDEPACRLRRCPPVEVEQRGGRGTADHTAQGCGLRFVLAGGHAVQVTKGPDRSDKPMTQTVACPTLYPYVIRTFCDRVVRVGRGDADLRRLCRRPRGQRRRRLPLRLGVRAVIEAAAERRLEGDGRDRRAAVSAVRRSPSRPTRVRCGAAPGRAAATA